MEVDWKKREDTHGKRRTAQRAHLGQAPDERKRAQYPENKSGRRNEGFGSAELVLFHSARFSAMFLDQRGALG